MQSAVADKILAPLAGIPVFLHSIHTFLQSGIIDQFTIVYRDDKQKADLEAALQTIDLAGKTVLWVAGGKERQDSVINALKLQTDQCAIVYIHDCARPLIHTQALLELQAAVLEDHAATLAHPVTDTIKRVPRDGKVKRVNLEDLERARLWAMETPQAFTYSKIKQAYQQVQDKSLNITDDSAAATLTGLAVTLVTNSKPNPKITTAADLIYAEWLVQKA